MALESGQLLEDEKLINEILANKKNKELNIKYDIKEGDELPDGELKNAILESVEKKKIEKENEDSPFEKNVKNFYKNNISGSAKTEYPKMSEIYDINTNWKSDLKLGVA